MVEIIYGNEPGAGPDVAIPLGEPRRIILITFGCTLSLIGAISTYLFQQISKKDNNLRQRGRYLVTLQGYFGTLFFAVIYIYQAFKYRFPCVVLYWGSYYGLIPFVLFFTGRAWRLITRFDRNNAIYQSRFAEPADLAALSTSPSMRQSSGNLASKDAILLPATSDPSLPNLSTLPTQHTSPRPHDQGYGPHRDMQEQEKVFELMHKSLEEIAQSKKWYNRYRAVSDIQMLGVAVMYMVLSTIIALSFQVDVATISVDPLSFNCHSGAEYVFPYVTMIVFVFLLSPFMIYQLKGINDGFGIRNEFIYLSFFSAPCVALYFIMPALAPEFTRKFVDRTTFMALILIASHITSTLIPLARHFKAYPHQCAYTAWATQRRSRRKKSPAMGLSSVAERKDIPRNPRPGPGAGIPNWMGSEDIPMETSMQGVDEDMVMSGISTYPHALKLMQASRSNGPQDEQQGTLVEYPGTSDEHNQKNNVSNVNLSLKSLIRNHRRERFGIGGNGQQEARVDSKKTDWDEFIRALEDRTLFDKISAFTVREFCAENMRFLYEVSRLERRAVQYEHLRDLTSTSHEVPQTNATGTGEFDQATENAASSSTPSSEGLTKSASTGTRHSTISPLPSHFSSPSKAVDSNQTPHRIKKIVSVSSVGSTAPILGPRRSSSSLFDESEPSSPLGSSSRSTFRRYESSSTAFPELEAGINSEPALAFTNIALDPSPHLDVLHIPAQTFAPLPMPPTLLIQFEYVYKTFIVSGARLELNLSHDTSQEIHQKARRGEWQSGMFDGAIYEIQELLFRDVWPKFVTSSHGLNYTGSLTVESDPAHLQEVGMASGHLGAIGTSQHTSMYLPSESQPTLPTQRTTPPPSILPTSPKPSLSRATSSKVKAPSVSDPHLSHDSGSGGISPTLTRSGSIGSSRTQERKEDVFQEEPSRTGFKTWLAKKSRAGITTAGMISRGCSTEESLGIIEQSRKSTADRRSDTSGLYSTSIHASH